MKAFIKSHRPAILVVLLLSIAAAAFSLPGVFSPERVVQPIAFDHQRHLKEDMTCKDCHKQVEKGPMATFPTVKACLLCHGEEQGKHPDEPKVREFAEKKMEIPWVQIDRQPGHVYFSHVMHVKRGKIECETCHGDMKNQTAPAEYPKQSWLTMDRCIACHKEKHAETECLTCHK